VNWDASLWHVGVNTSSNGYDRLRLDDGVTTVYFDGFPGFNGDPGRCTGGVATRIRTETGVLDVQPAVAANGTAIAGSAAGESYVMYLVKRDALGTGNPVTLVWYVDCRALVTGSAVLQITVIVNLGAYAIEQSAIQTLLAALIMPAANGPNQTPGGPPPPPGRGSLLILTLDQNGAPLTGACFDITANTGPRYEKLATLCDDTDGTQDGRLELDGVPAGHALFANTTAPPGYDPASFEADIAADQTTTLSVCYTTGTANPDALPPFTSSKTDYVDDQGYILARLTTTGLTVDRGSDGRTGDPPAGSHYLLLTLSIENTGNTPLPLRPEQFVMDDTAYALHPAASDSATLVRDGSGLAAMSLPPKQTVERTLVFTIRDGTARPQRFFYRPAVGRLIFLQIVDFRTGNGLCSASAARGTGS
jgi:hypothetical protein